MRGDVIGFYWDQHVNDLSWRMQGSICTWSISPPWSRGQGDSTTRLQKSKLNKDNMSLVTSSSNVLYMVGTLTTYCCPHYPASIQWFSICASISALLPFCNHDYCKTKKGRIKCSEEYLCMCLNYLYKLSVGVRSIFVYNIGLNMINWDKEWEMIVHMWLSKSCLLFMHALSIDAIDFNWQNRQTSMSRFFFLLLPFPFHVTTPLPYSSF